MTNHHTPELPNPFQPIEAFLATERHRELLGIAAEQRLAGRVRRRFVRRGA